MYRRSNGRPGRQSAVGLPITVIVMLRILPASVRRREQAVGE